MRSFGQAHDLDAGVDGKRCYNGFWLGGVVNYGRIQAGVMLRRGRRVCRSSRGPAQVAKSVEMLEAPTRPGEVQT